MSDVMLLGVLRMPMPDNPTPLMLRQFVDRARQAADRIDALERENAALRKDAERWRFARKALTWAGDWDGEVRWTMLLTMPEPDVSAAGLTSDSVAQELDAAINAAMQRHTGGQGGNIAGDGKNPLPDVAYAGQGWKK